MEVLDGWGLVALQGPEAASYLQSLTSFDLRALTFGRSAFVPIDGGYNLHVARGGYTGEDGFEISIPPDQTEEVVRELFTKDPVMLVGLGARDSLRLEAGMCLYGSDLDEFTSPVEAALGWVIGKDRKERLDFIGAEVVAEHLKSGPPRRRVGMIVEGAPARRECFLWCPFGLFLDEFFCRWRKDIPSWFYRGARDCNIGHTLTYTWEEHRDGICEEWVA